MKKPKMSPVELLQSEMNRAFPNKPMSLKDAQELYDELLRRLNEAPDESKSTHGNDIAKSRGPTFH